jgi:hypothetical protein
MKMQSKYLYHHKKKVRKKKGTHIANLTLNAENPLVSRCSKVQNSIIQPCILIDTNKLFSSLHESNSLVFGLNYLRSSSKKSQLPQNNQETTETR